jgi:hypothetical protein
MRVSNHHNRTDTTLNEDSLYLDQHCSGSSKFRSGTVVCLGHDGPGTLRVIVVSTSHAPTHKHRYVVLCTSSIFPSFPHDYRRFEARWIPSQSWKLDYCKLDFVDQFH